MLVRRQKEVYSKQAVRGNGEKRREQIIEAAVNQFAEHGFRGTTTKDIAQAAGLSEGGLFQYFKTKSELYAAILDEKARQIYENGWLDEVNEYVAKNDDECVFKAIAMKIIENGEHNPNFIRLMCYTALERHENAQPFRRKMLYPIFELLRNYIEKRQKEKLFRECNAEAAAFSFIGAQIYYVMSKTLFQSRMLTASEEDVVSNSVKLTLNGLRQNP